MTESSQKEILSYLRSKIKCLKKYLAASADFLGLQDEKAFPGIPAFEIKRESSLKALQLFERKLADAAARLPQRLRTAAFVHEVQIAETQSQELVGRILAVDNDILAKIERVKEALARELKRSRKHKDALSKFKSNWAEEPSSGSVDKKL